MRGADPILRAERYGRCRRRAAPSPGGTERCGATEAVRRSAAIRAPRLERGDPANARSNPYRSAAQGRLLAMLAPSLTDQEAALAAADLLDYAARTEDYLTREAIARAIAALAPKAARARAPTGAHGGQDGARQDRIFGRSHRICSRGRCATAGRARRRHRRDRRGAEVSDRDRGAERGPARSPGEAWPEEHKAIAGRTLPDLMVLDWLESICPKATA